VAYSSWLVTDIVGVNDYFECNSQFSIGRNSRRMAILTVLPLRSQR
jgi:hypothetical protein